MKQPGIKRLIEFHKLLNSFAEIERVVHVKRHGNHVLESDTEHAYNLTMMAWLIADYFPELDKDKIIKLALVHDLVEIHAGDTYVFADQSYLDSKQEREEAAKQNSPKTGLILLHCMMPLPNMKLSKLPKHASPTHSTRSCQCSPYTLTMASHGTKRKLH